MSLDTAVRATDAAKPTVVLVHGAFAESASWNGVIPLLATDGYSVVAAANPLRENVAPAGRRSCRWVAHRPRGTDTGVRQRRPIAWPCSSVPSLLGSGQHFRPDPPIACQAIAPEGASCRGIDGTPAPVHAHMVQR